VFKNKSIFLRFRLHFLPDMPKLVSNFRKIVRQRWEMLYGFCWKFTWLSSSERIWKIR